MKPLSTTLMASAVAVTALVAPAHAEHKSGFYIGGDIGASFASDSEYDGFSNDIDHDTGTAVSGVFGYEFAQQSWGNLRSELEVFYTENDISDQIDLLGGVQPLTGDVKTSGAMANVYYDMSQFGGPIVPYVGAGIGFAELDVDLVTPIASYSDDDTQFAYQAMLGARWHLTDHWSLQAEAAYQSMDSATLKATPDLVSLSVPVNSDFDFETVKTTIGATYTF